LVKHEGVIGLTKDETHERCTSSATRVVALILRTVFSWSLP
jgi:hypothetical protein